MSPRAAARLESLGFTHVYDYVPGKADWYARGLPLEGQQAGAPRAGTLAQRDVPVCRLADSVDVAQGRTRDAGWDACVVVDESDVVLGVIEGSAWDTDSQASVEQVMEEGPATFRPSASLDMVVTYMNRRHLDRVLVTTSDGRLVGWLTRDDAEQHAS